MGSLTVTIISVLIALIGTYFESFLIAAIASGIAVLGAVTQYLDSEAYEFVFDENCWINGIGGREYKLRVSKQMHKKTNPIARALIKEGLTYSEVGVDINLDEDGAVIVVANKVFEGKLIIK